MQRELYTADHEDFRGLVRDFLKREVVPNLERWEEARIIDRDVWVSAGENGIIGLTCPEVYGGGGQEQDYRFRNVVHEELARVFAASLASGFSLQDDVAIPYINGIGTEEQKQRWLPGLAAGELIGAIAMTEPGTGSDLRGIRTAAHKVDGGWRVSGSKMFITNGIHADLAIIVARTDPAGGANGFSLLVVERGFEGFTRGRKLSKVGLHAQDTAELFLDDVFAPDANVLGEIGGGFGQLGKHLPLERLSIGAHSIANADAIFAETVRYTKERHAFGQPLADFQNTQFELAAMETELDVTRAFIDKAVLSLGKGELTVVDAAKAKLWASEVHNRVVDRCLQLHGGYGFMTEYPVGRAYQDARVQRLFGGANEIMKHIIGKDILRR